MVLVNSPQLIWEGVESTHLYSAPYLFIADWITWRSPAPWGCMTPLGPICIGPGWPGPCCCPAMWMGTPEGAMPELSGCCCWSPPPICCHCCCCWGCDPAPPAIVTVPPVIPAIPIVMVIPPGGPPTEEVGICWPGMVTYVTLFCKLFTIKEMEIKKHIHNQG